MLDDDQRRAFLASARRRRFARNEVVFHEGDPGDSLHLVAKGHLAIRVTTPMGDVATVRVVRPGEFFGELAVLSPAPRNATVVAIDAAETLAVHRDEFDQLRHDHPAVEAVLLEAMVSEVRRLAAALLDALYVPVEKRVWRRLLDLTAVFGGDDAVVEIPLTQEDIAQVVGTTRPRVNGVLKTGEQLGFLEVRRGRLVVNDVGALRAKAR